MNTGITIIVILFLTSLIVIAITLQKIKEELAHKNYLAEELNSIMYQLLNKLKK